MASRHQASEDNPRTPIPPSLRLQIYSALPFETQLEAEKGAVMLDEYLKNDPETRVIALNDLLQLLTKNRISLSHIWEYCKRDNRTSAARDHDMRNLIEHLRPKAPLFFPSPSRINGDMKGQAWTVDSIFGNTLLVMANYLFYDDRFGESGEAFLRAALDLLREFEAKGMRSDIIWVEEAGDFPPQDGGTRA